MLFDEFRMQIMTSLGSRQEEKRSGVEMFVGKSSNAMTIFSILIR
jgi:hypothetical protein